LQSAIASFVCFDNLSADFVSVRVLCCEEHRYYYIMHTVFLVIR